MLEKSLESETEEYMRALWYVILRHLRVQRKLLLSLVLLLCLTDGNAQSFARIQQPISQASVIDIPVRLSLEPLIKAAEKTLPDQVGNWHTWKDWHGIKSQYRAWRGPLNITVYSDLLTVQAHVRYWIRAHKKLLGVINMKGSCGINEPPRQALIGMQVRLGWGRDWTLRPMFHILPTRFLDRCEMTIANIDITPLIEKEFRKQMQNSLRAALPKLASGMNTIRLQAQRTWLSLQEPVDLGQDNWLMFRPMGVALSHLAGRGKHIDARLAVLFQPELVTGSLPAASTAPLPPLGYYYPHSPGLSLYVGLTLDFARLNQQLSDILAGKSFAITGINVGIKKFDISGSGQELRARMELAEDAAGTVELRARVIYDVRDRKLELQDLIIDYDAEDFDVILLAEPIREHIRQTLQNAANKALAQYLNLLGERLRTILQKITPASMAFDMSDLQLRTLKIHFVQQGIRLDGTATGSVRIVFR
jgi:hypothetical protein